MGPKKHPERGRGAAAAREIGIKSRKGSGKVKGGKRGGGGHQK